ncbi:MAG: hypothetical protein GDA43_00375 [Hormoscilla sp. SP5CHS1]|nr:hypothetical protein [Hormoscilla sp. SP12CHS1]MBC6451827.1 hypothetical protein [Hormoscilla sp. SP5CHS1]MBC6475757.1 hypothetical protein [Hormoscilla sp. GM102CHS1]
MSRFQGPQGFDVSGNGAVLGTLAAHGLLALPKKHSRGDREVCAIAPILYHRCLFETDVSNLLTT